MSKRKKHKKKSFIKNIVWKNRYNKSLVIFLLVVGILAAAGKGFSYTHTNVIYPGVFVGSISLGGLTKAEAAKSLETTLADFEQNGLTFVFRDRNVTVPTVVATTEDPDLSYELMSYDLDAIIEEVDAYGRSGNFLDQWQQRLFGIVRRHVIDPNIVWKEEAIRDLLKENLATLEHPAQDAEIIIRNGTVLLSDEKDGIIFNYDRALSEARSQLKTLVFFIKTIPKWIPFWIPKSIDFGTSKRCLK